MKFKFSFILLLCSYVFANLAAATGNVWDVLRSQFRLNHETTQPAVQTQLRWLIAHPSYLNKLARSEPYIYHIVTEIKKRNLPGELALIPMIESAYDPFAYSGAGAAGLWQLMPGTGTTLGLKQDWWSDARRSIRPSTEAALNYLTYLHKFFTGNWILAIAAYDSGEGTVARTIKYSRQSLKNIRFWSLPLPNETRAYVPRLLALAEIIKYPERYRISLPDIPHVPYFEEVNIGSQIDLNHAAKLAGISYKDLIKLNPGYNRWTTAPYKPFKLLIPANKVANFNRNLAHVAEENRVSWTRYQVRAGDDLNAIAKRNFTTVNLLRKLNQLKSSKLRVGQYVLIPSTKNAPVIARKPLAVSREREVMITPTYKVLHIVQRGDNFKTLEKKYRVSALEIRQWNNLKEEQLKPGQQLTIWQRTKRDMLYTVKRGDTASRIAKLNHVTMPLLARLNPSVNLDRLHPGQKIVLAV